MVKKIDYSKGEVKSLILELESELLKVNIALERLENSVELLQTGDKIGPYWNGDNAYQIMNSCVGHIDHDRYLLYELDGCFKYLTSISDKNS